MHFLSQFNLLPLLFVTILCSKTLYGCDKNNEQDLVKYNSFIAVSVRYDCQHKNEPNTHCCSGTILTESYILTAANCVDSLSSRLSSVDLTIAAGIYNRSKSNEVIRKVDQIVIHSKWINDRHGRKHNIALLHLSTPLDFTSDKCIARIYRPADFNSLKNVLEYPSSSIPLSGISWERQHISAATSFGVKQFEISLVDYNDPICYRLVSNIEQQFCTRLYPDSQDASGEPILQWIENRWMQVGLLSSVVDTADGNCLRIYTRLAYYQEWIESIVNSKNLKSSNIANAPMIYECNPTTTECGCSRENVALSSAKIFGGEEAVPFSWSMIVSVRLKNSEEHSCSGTILTAYYILTSADCVDGASDFEVTIAAGIHDRITDFAMIRYAHEIYIHPHWNKSDGTYRNDIAILRIFPPLSIPGGFSLARTCISYTNSKNETINYPSAGSNLVVVGWGSTRYNESYFSDTLHQAGINMIDNNDSICQAVIHDVEKQFCAGAYEKGPCRGDSGGPILQWKGTYWEQVGITSYGGDCHHSDALSIFTRLTYYFDWIESVINISLTTTTPKPPPQPVSYACDKALSCGCGMSDVALMSSRIVGGENAIKNSWPMVVSLRFNGTNDHSCGGTILSSSYILTAAHCFRQISIDDPRGITIAAGMLNRSDPLQIIRNVDRIYIHPNFTNLPDDYRHDVALLHIDQPFVFASNSNITKTCIHRINPLIPVSENPKNGSRLAVIGWGQLLQQAPFIPEILQQVEIFTIDNQDPTCSVSINNTDFLFCSGLYEGGKDSCQGDSGGPIFQWTGEYWEQVGIISHGKGCALPGFPGVYVRLSYYYNWIEEILKRDGEHLEPGIPQTTTPNTACAFKFNILIFGSLVLLFLSY
ncbi:unnamed protein product [Rotaria socialis]|uniref:Peptidase S1 domain-containing protein n=3 Tax=Rotaria socialis TaxID=392032 RepID=A0A817ZMB4_9BILA|nr:unnamed protein product [Rotaria socialis]